MGDPVGPKSERHELAWRFNELADGRGARAAFYEVSDENLPLYIDLGLSVLKLGEEAVVPLAEFSLDSGQLLELRRSYHDAAREGATLEVLQAEQVGDVLPVLREISASWMVGHKTPERGFSVGRFDEQYLSRLPVAIVRIGTQPVAFASLWVGGREELSVDFMRFRPDAPPHTMDFLMTELIHWGRAREFARFSLGLSPVEGPADQQLAPLLNTIGPSLFRHGEHFYNFEGLRMYKEKFAPRWEPRFFAAASGVALARVLANVASATTTSTDHPVP
jgi:phosphatidylglycerol lysyltransferase